MGTTKSGKSLRVTLIKSPYGRGRDAMACVQGLGLRRQRDSRVLEDSAAVRGMISRVSFLVKCEEC
jgi:large subunit ribosomal protein L30